MPAYALPDLPYDYSALEPHISGKIMELHHGTHHKAYVTGVNTALDKLREARSSGDVSTVGKLSKDVAFHLGGHVNHSLFWLNMAPDAGGAPDGELSAAIIDEFGSYDAFKAHFTGVAMQLQGSGWAILAWDSLGQRLIIEQLYDQQGNLAASTVPLLMLDMWEHAYYLQYQATKADYVAAWWNVANWADVAARFDRARTQTAGLLVP